MSLLETAPAATGPAPSAAEGRDVPASTAAAPPPRARRLLGWGFVIVLLIGIALLSMRFVATAPVLEGVLHPESPNPRGGQALAELARAQGVDITVTRSRTEAAALLRDDVTLVLSDPFPLSDEAVEELLENADRVVLLTSSSRTLRLLDLGELGGFGESTDAGCPVPEFARTGDIEPERLFVPASDVTGCYVGADGAAVLRSDRDGRVITLLEGRRLLSNGSLAEDGNAALGLALIAQTERVVWYVPSYADGDIAQEGPQNIGALTPEWVTPAILLLFAAGGAAIWWRGRRFGPLVAESLPVTVRASETMHGRARLTAQAADAAHATEAVRAGTLMRLARRLGLSARATAQEVADAASDRLRVPRGSLYDLLAGPPAASDGDLVELARRLAELETAVETTVRTERNLP